jgi:hypothetical protein
MDLLVSGPNDPHIMRHSVVDRFAMACRTDPRVVAAFVSGSHARGTGDAHSDIDLGLITTECAYNEFRATQADFINLLGEPLFLESFNSPTTLFFILADGTEGELAVGHERNVEQLAIGPYLVLLDKHGILQRATMRGAQPDPAEQREALRRLIVWFWHEMSHFITAIARGQLLWAYGQLEALRRSCLSLSRLSRDFHDTDIELEAYFKVDLVLPTEQLSAYTASVCPMDARAMLIAAQTIGHVYREIAPGLAEAHGLPYPLALERLMLERLNSTGLVRSRSGAASA